MADLEPHSTKTLPLRCKACALVSDVEVSRCPFEPARRDAGAALVGRDDAAGVVYLRRGRAVLTGAAPDGTAHCCAVRGPGSLLGLEAVLGRPVPYEACALTDVAICVAGA